MTVSVYDLAVGPHTNHVKNDFSGLETINYYIHNTEGFIYTEAILDGRDFAFAHDLGSQKFIEDVFDSIDLEIELDFKRVENASLSNIDIYYLGDFSGGIAGLTYSNSPYDSKIEILWESQNKYSNLYGGYGSLKDADAYTLIHEIGHSLGLRHPNDDPYGDWHNSKDTVMSYNFLFDINKQQTYATGWSQNDIKALEYLWGIETGISPTDILLSSLIFNENLIPNSKIATISTIDLDKDDQHIFQLKKGIDDNHMFTIDGYNLKINSTPDYEYKSTYKITIGVEDSYEHKFEKSFILNVKDLPNPSDMDDQIIGTSFSEIIKSLASNDIINGREGDDIIDGGNDYDIAIYSGNYNEYTLSKKNKKVTIKDNRLGLNDGFDTLYNVEKISFSDKNALVISSGIKVINEFGYQTQKIYEGTSDSYKFYNLGSNNYGVETISSIDQFTGSTLLKFDDKSLSIIDDIKETFDQLTGLKNDASGVIFRLYNAAFSRFPDAKGLKYWIRNFSSGTDDLRAVSSSFILSNEFKQRYGDNISNQKFVENLYTNVLNRDFDQKGYDYWVGNLNKGIEDKHEVLLGFSESIENKDLFTEVTSIF